MPDDNRHTDKEFDLGLLFIHGIGTQTRGQTLKESGGPLFQWIQDRCEALARRRKESGTSIEDVDRWLRQLEGVEWGLAGTSQLHSPDVAAPGAEAEGEALVRRAVLHETLFHDPTDSTAPAHAKLTVLSVDRNERVTAGRWLLAESWWADTFSAPTFDDLARWGLGVLPWIIGSHFGAQVLRRLSERPTRHPLSKAQAGRTLVYRHPWALSGWLWRLAAAIGGLGFGLLSTVMMIPILAVLLALGAIPVPRLRSALLGMQLRMAATLGDCYVLLARPIEAAAIVNEVRRDLMWLATRCSEVVIVAHSQGGAVAHLALRGTVPKELKLLFTFGSGLRKLEEARQLMKSGGSFVLSAALTSIALGLLLLCSGLLIAVVFGNARASPASVMTILLYGVGAVAVCVAGIRDHLRGIQLAELGRWIERLKSTRLRWVDCYASADPVPNGMVAPTARDLTREVCNYSSMLGDHTAYWRNADEFVSLLYGEIAGARTRDPFPDLRLTDDSLQQVARRRRWRVAIGRTIQWMGAAGVVVVMARRWPAWQNVGLWGWSQGGAWLSSVLGMRAGKATTFSVDWPALGLLASVLVPYWIVRRVWTSWNKSEMHKALGLESSRWSSYVAVSAGTWLLLLIVTGLAIERYPPFWVFAALFLPTMVFTILEPRERRDARDRKDTSTRVSDADVGSPPTTSVEGLVSLALAIGIAAAMPFSLGLSLWKVFVWLTARLSGGTIAGFRPASVSSMVVGGVVALLFLLGWGVYYRWSSRRRTQASKGL